MNTERREFLKIMLAATGGFLLKVGLDNLPPIPLTPNPILQSDKKEVLGFAPHWAIGGVSDEELKVLTALAYFNLPLGGDGNPRTGNLGYQVLQSKETEVLFEKARKNKTQLMLTTAVENRSGLMDSEEIAALLNDKDSKQRAIRAITESIKKHDMDAINVDFEYWGEVSEELRDNLTHFVEDLKNRADVRVSVSVYASSAINYHIFDIAKLGRVADDLVIMAYDFYNERSQIVAPTAPLDGHPEGRYWYDVRSSVEDLKDLVQSKKLILGIPQYDHARLVVEDGEMATIRPSFILTEDPFVHIKPETLTMDGLRFRLRNSQYNRSGWDPVAKVGWWSYLDEYDIRRMVYMEDERSIAEKCDLVLKEDLRGIAFWASGFNSEDESISEVLRQKF